MYSRGYETGAIDYLFRPVDVNILTSKVKAFLQMHRQKFLLEQEVEQRKKTEAALRIAEEKYHSIFERAVEGIFQCSVEGEFLEVNPTMLRILGFDSADEVVGRPGMRSAVMADDSERELYEEVLIRNGSMSNFEYRLQRKSGEVIWCSESSRMVQSDTGGSFIEGVLEDITERKRAELELKRLATVDSLTGIANRHRFFDRLEHALAVAKRYDNQVAVLFVDLNDFKRINDTHGHQTGDELLCMVADRLQQRTPRVRYPGPVGRGRIRHISDGYPGKRESALAVTRDLLEVVKRPYAIQGHDLTIGATIGISFLPVRRQR